MNTQGYIRCEICGDVRQGERQLLMHISIIHGGTNLYDVVCGGDKCFCGRRVQDIRALGKRFDDNGGYAQHYTDFLMGVKEGDA